MLLDQRAFCKILCLSVEVFGTTPTNLPCRYTLIEGLDVIIDRVARLGGAQIVGTGTLTNHTHASLSL